MLEFEKCVGDQCYDHETLQRRFEELKFDFYWTRQSFNRDKYGHSVISTELEVKTVARGWTNHHYEV